MNHVPVQPTASSVGQALHKPTNNLVQQPQAGYPTNSMSQQPYQG